MAEIIAILNQKGGCGKTTTVVNLAAALAVYGKKVLVVDMDPQGNATTGMGIEKNKVAQTIYSVLTGETNIKDTILNTKIQGLDIIPSNIALSGAEIELSKEVGYHTILETAIEVVYEDYDYIFIDVPPS